MISLLVLKTNQLEKQKVFYETLGLFFQKEKHGKGPEHFSAFMKEQNMVLETYPLPKNQTTLDATTRLGFRVDDLKKTVAAILEIGEEVKNEIRVSEFGTFAVVK